MLTRSSSVSFRPQPALASNEAATSAAPGGSMMLGKKSKAAREMERVRPALSESEEGAAGRTSHVAERC